jgi:hypothetical protein
MNHLGGRLRRKPAPHLPHQLADLPLRPGQRLLQPWAVCRSEERMGRIGWGYPSLRWDWCDMERWEEIEMEMSVWKAGITFSSVAHSYPPPFVGRAS